MIHDISKISVAIRTFELNKYCNVILQHKAKDLRDLFKHAQRFYKLKINLRDQSL
jgi:hypothetical protein